MENTDVSSQYSVHIAKELNDKCDEYNHCMYVCV